MQMTYRKAIIILDRLVTTERIEVDRDELRAAVKVAQKALNIVADLPPNHGRLIDADFLVHMLNLTLMPIRCSAGVDIDSMDENEKILVRSVIRQIERVPTIIEAEVSE